VTTDLWPQYHHFLGIQRTCLHCGERITFDGVWRHNDGIFYRQRCTQCDWTGGDAPAGSDCPVCGVPGILDDHVAVPVLAEDRERIRKAVYR
jgi:hypothetical protein